MSGANIIGYCITDTPLGLMLVAANDSGVVAVWFSDSSCQLEAELRGHFANADLVEQDRLCHQYSQTISSYIDGRSLSNNIPLNLQGTVFQKTVWRALLQIPFGTLLSYSELASLIDKPGAVRAVAAACAANQIAVLVPCHRVIAKNGTLAGYKWGLERKKWLLAKEQALVHAASSTD